MKFQVIALATAAALFVDAGAQVPDACLADSSKIRLANSNPCNEFTSQGLSSKKVGPISVGDCCADVSGGADTRRMLEGRARNLQDPGICRDVEVEDPYCDAASFVCDTDEMELDVIFRFDVTEDLTEDELCCSKCHCWGDPRCESFSGEQEEWIICDDRLPGSCLHKPRRCRKSKDHLNQKCEFVRRTRKPDSDAEMPWYYSWEQNGSPCQSTAIWEGDSENYPRMQMYGSGDDSLVLTLGERGVVTEAQITRSGQGSSTTYTLSAASCSGDSGVNDVAWVASDGVVPANFAPGVKLNEVENLFTVTSVDERVIFEFTCAQLAASTDSNRERIDITITDTRQDTSTSNLEGFCATGKISEKKGKNQMPPEESLKCLFQEIEDDVAACKAIVTPACNKFNVEANIAVWCRRAPIELIGTPPLTEQECIDTLVAESQASPPSSVKWAEYVCEMDHTDPSTGVLDSDGQARCMQTIAEDGWHVYAQERTAPVVGPSSGSCANSITEYSSTKENECDQGVMLQYFDGDDWVDVYFIPKDFPPCSGDGTPGGAGLLELRGADNPELFLNPIRFAQCEEIQSQCQVKNDCLPTPGFTVEFDFRTVSCRSSCYNCETFGNQSPRICVTEDDELKELANCVSCCEPEEEETPPEVTDFGICRAQSTDRAYCDAEVDGAERCAELIEPSSNAELTVTVTFDNEETPTCCLDCLAYGDPELTPFRTTNIIPWILCDGRDINTCQVTREECEAQFDHLGDRCEFTEPQPDARPADIGALGSPCQTKNQDMPAKMVMYEVEGETPFKLEITLGERAVITSTEVTFGGTTYELTAAACFQGGNPLEQWSPPLPASIESQYIPDESVTSTINEGGWTFVTDAKIFVRLTCIEMTASTGDVGYRMNVDHIIETDEDREADTSVASGYCQDGIIPYGDSGMTETLFNTNPPSVFDVCTWDRWTNGLSMCKGLTSNACTPGKIFRGVDSWCDFANLYTNLPIAERRKKCRDYIKTTNPPDEPSNRFFNQLGTRWAELYCEAISANRQQSMSVRNFVNQCKANIQQATFGILAQVEAFGKGQLNSDTAPCESQDTYGKRPEGDFCTQGITVEYFEDGMWKEEFFVPFFKPMCPEFVISATDRPNLFLHPIRFKQCQQVDETGKCSVEDTCLPALGYEVQYKFSQRASVCQS